MIACVAGGMRERANGGRAAIFLSGEAREEFASGEAASEGRYLVYLSYSGLKYPNIGMLNTPIGPSTAGHGPL